MRGQFPARKINSSRRRNLYRGRRRFELAGGFLSAEGGEPGSGRAARLCGKSLKLPEPSIGTNFPSYFCQPVTGTVHGYTVTVKACRKVSDLHIQESMYREYGSKKHKIGPQAIIGVPCAARANLGYQLSQNSRNSGNCGNSSPQHRTTSWRLIFT
jgi:hypothetical protein